MLEKYFKDTERLERLGREAEAKKFLISPEELNIYDPFYRIFMQNTLGGFSRAIQIS